MGALLGAPSHSQLFIIAKGAPDPIVVNHQSVKINYIIKLDDMIMIMIIKKN